MKTDSSIRLEKRTNPDEEREGDLKVLCSVPDQNLGRGPDPGRGQGGEQESVGLFFAPQNRTLLKFLRCKGWII